MVDELVAVFELPKEVRSGKKDIPFCAFCDIKNPKDQTVLVPVLVKDKTGEYASLLCCLTHLYDPNEKSPKTGYVT